MRSFESTFTNQLSLDPYAVARYFRTVIKKDLENLIFLFLTLQLRFCVCGGFRSSVMIFSPDLIDSTSELFYTRAQLRAGTFRDLGLLKDFDAFYLWQHS